MADHEHDWIAISTGKNMNGETYGLLLRCSTCGATEWRYL